MKRLSFKVTGATARQFSIAIGQARSRKQQKQLLAQFLATIAS